LQTKVYFKPTDTHQLLHRTSFHPAYTFKGIVKSQFIRFKRISSTYTDFADACHTLVKVLLTRGYNARELQKLKSEVWRNYADRPNRGLNQEVKKDIIPVVTHYDNFHARLNKRWCRVIRNNPVFDTVRVISAYKRHKNLADLLVRGRLGRPNAVANPPSQDEDEDQRVEAMLDALIEVINRDNLSPARLPGVKNYTSTLPIPVRPFTPLIIPPGNEPWGLDSPDSSGASSSLLTPSGDVLLRYFEDGRRACTKKYCRWDSISAVEIFIPKNTTYCVV